jgi:KaiC/GvpD/RAD55 family RecA-like ATPase
MSEEKDKEKSVQETAKAIAEAVKLVLANATQNEWASVNAPFAQKMEQAKSQKVVKPTVGEENKKELSPFKTFSFLDMMFLDSNDKPIEGIPFGSNSILTGLPNSGKSLLIEEIALRVADSGKKVCFVTSEEAWKTETPRFDLESRFRERAKILGLNWENISKNLSVIDTVMFAELREWNAFVSTYRSLAEGEGIDLLLVDSMTLLEDVRGQIKYRVLELMRYNQIHGITSILVNQRAIEESDTLAMAGGISISHIVDAVFVLDYKKISSWDGTIKMDVPSAKQGAILNFFRILKCRLCRFNAHYLGYEITKDGFVKLIPKETSEPKNQKPL